MEMVKSMKDCCPLYMYKGREVELALDALNYIPTKILGGRHQMRQKLVSQLIENADCVTETCGDDDGFLILKRNIEDHEDRHFELEQEKSYEQL